MTTPKFEYDQNIPQVNDDLATSQGDFLSNFQQLYNAFAQNHVPLDGATIGGNHTVIELLNSPVGFETSAGEISLYAKPVEKQTGQLFMRYQGNTQDVQYTNYQIYTPNSPQPGQIGFFTTLPGGLIVYFGSIVFSANKDNYLLLDPSITKELFTVNFCTFGLTPSQAPTFTVPTSINGIITKIQAQPLTFSPGFLYYYLIVGKT